MILLAAIALAAAPWGPEDGDPIAGPWRLLERLPGVEGPSCLARAAGAEVNVDILLNNDGDPILIAARPDWAHGGEAEISLTIDTDAPRTLKAQMVANLVMVLLSDRALLERLKAARSIEWGMPFGRFRANIADFGAALGAMKSCKARGHAAPPRSSS